MINFPEKLPVPYHEENWSTLDSTKLQTYASCPRKYFFSYVLGWTPETSSNHLVFGQAWHTALEHIYRTKFKPTEFGNAYGKFLSLYREEFPETTDQWFGGKTPERAASALAEYINHYVADAVRFEVVDTEVGGQVFLTEDKLITVKLDLVGKDEKGFFVLEHKTGSQCGDSWAEQWKTSLQIGAYLHTLYTCYGEERPRVIVNGTFFYKGMRKFLRVPCSRSDDMMAVWLETTLNLMGRIDEDFEKLASNKAEDITMTSFYLNPTSCGNYAGCPFRDLCTTKANPLQWVEDGVIPSGYKSYWWDPLADIRKTL